jgi:hypothetical protein
LYPNRGVGFNVRRKNWAEGVKYSIKRADFKVNYHQFSHIDLLHFMESNTSIQQQKNKKLSSTFLIKYKDLTKEDSGPTNWAVLLNSKLIMTLHITRLIMKLLSD